MMCNMWFSYGWLCHLWWLIDFLQSLEFERESTSRVACPEMCMLTLYVIQGRPSPKQTWRIDLDSSAPLWAEVICDLCPLLWSERQAAISTTHLFNQATGGGTEGRSVNHSMPPLLFSHPLARPLDGRVLRFVKASVSQWQVDRWGFKSTSGSLGASWLLCK